MLKNIVVLKIDFFFLKKGKYFCAYICVQNCFNIFVYVRDQTNIFISPHNTSITVLKLE